MWTLKYDTNENIYKTETVSQIFENRFVVARGKGRKGRKDWGLGLADANYYI